MTQTTTREHLYVVSFYLFTGEDCTMSGFNWLYPETTHAQALEAFDKEVTAQGAGAEDHSVLVRLLRVLVDWDDTAREGGEAAEAITSQIDGDVDDYPALREVRTPA